MIRADRDWNLDRGRLRAYGDPVRGARAEAVAERLTGARLAALSPLDYEPANGRLPKIKR